MILNLRVDHKIADIQSMENISKEMDDLFWKLQEKYSVSEYVEISTCNRKEYYIHNDYISENDELLSHENESIIIEYGQSSVIHLLRMTSGLESMIVGEDQILGQVKDSKNKSIKNHHCGKVLDTVFTKAIHVGQVVRNKTNINKGSVSIGSAAIKPISIRVLYQLVLLQLIWLKNIWGALTINPFWLSVLEKWASWLLKRLLKKI